MYYITVQDFSTWRVDAKRMLASSIQPADIVWLDHTATQTQLFFENTLPAAGEQTFFIPKEFMALALLVAAHTDFERWNLLYQALWRITHNEKFLLNISSDPLVRKLFLLQKNVTRDMHKMKAFVRFRKILVEDQEYFAAWYKPDHHIVRYVAPFFKKRFAVMRWTIMTPDETVSWNGTELIYSAGIPVSPQIDDEIESLWCTYYKSIFNPARVKIKAMKAEMPVRYWGTMPETKLIPELLQHAPERAAKMIKENEGFHVSAKDFLPEERTLTNLKNAIPNCRACTLYSCARQAVFGEGPDHAEIMLVGEQPGLQEDKQGRPFVGPAGQLLRDAMAEIDIDINRVYVSNIVKHFKHSVIGDRQIHRSPNVREVNACKPWVEEEIKLVKPKVVVCLGNTAAKGLITPGFAMNTNHGTWYEQNGIHYTGTFHPSAILRVPDEEKKNQMLAALKKDLLAAYTSNF